VQHKGIDDMLVKEEHKARYGVDASKSSKAGLVPAVEARFGSYVSSLLDSSRLPTTGRCCSYSPRSIPSTSARPTDSRHDSSLAMNSDR
jgi:hypothetical protein